LSENRRTLSKKFRQQQVLELKLGGYDNNRIAEVLDIKPSTVNRDINDVMHITDTAIEKSAEKVRMLLNTRLERLLTKYYNKAFAEDGDVESAEFVRKLIKDLRELWGTDLKSSDITIDARNQTIVWDKDENPQDVLEAKIRKFIEREKSDSVTSGSEKAN
jgi:DNA-binding CsgD family transcriptional regulator